MSTAAISKNPIIVFLSIYYLFLDFIISLNLLSHAMTRRHNLLLYLFLLVLNGGLNEIEEQRVWTQHC